MSFYRNAIIAFALQLVILLAIVGMILANLNKSQEFPATLSECPDFYTMNNRGDCIMDQNVYSETSAKCTTYTLADREKQTPSQRKKWAVDCGVAWDGVTNNSDVLVDQVKKCVSDCPA